MKLRSESIENADFCGPKTECEIDFSDLNRVEIPSHPVSLHKIYRSPFVLTAVNNPSSLVNPLQPLD